MKPTLSLQIGHQVTMTPQLQQAIKLLQLSALDLQAEISTIVETNPLLEFPDPDSVETDSSEIETTPWLSTTTGGLSKRTSSLDDLSEDAFQQKNAEPTLREHLLFQWNLTPATEQEKIIGEALIDAVNESGYLETPLEDVYATLKTQMTLKLEDIEPVLAKVQKLDPLGVCARNLKECLILQLKSLPKTTPWRKEALELVQQYLPILAKRDYATLRRRLQHPIEDVKSIIHLIQSMNPRPGSAISSQGTDYIVPDVFVTKRQRKWVVTLNPNNTPKLRINAYYAGMAQRSNSSRDNEFLRTHLQEARWFLKSLEARNATLLKVAECIVEKQEAFLEHGEIAMKPLILQDVASEIDMHESTVSRITTQKYMHTPRGIYELKHFFSSHLTTDSGHDCSSTAIRALIKKYIDSENRGKPLSDHQLSLLMAEQGIQVARRTIAKYREAMAILPSNERKQLL